MANTDIISFQLTDFKGRVATVPIFAPVGETVASLQGFVDAFAPVLDAVTGALITGVVVSKNLTLPIGIKGAALALHDIEKGVNFGFDALNTPYRHTLRVPAALETEISGESFDYTTALSVGETFVNKVITGEAPVIPSDRYGNDLNAVLSALVTFRK